jgi:hypothetical protein
MSLLDRLAAVPDPWNRTFLLLVVGASVVVTAISCVSDGATLSPAAGLALLSCLLAAWPMGSRPGVTSEPAQMMPAPSPSRALVLFAGALLLIAPALSIAHATYLGWLAAIVPLLLLVVWRLLLTEGLAVRLVLAPVALASPFLVTAIVMGRPQCAGFPSVLTILFAAVVFSTRNLEARLRVDSSERDPAAHPAYYRTLAAVSTLLFFFGVVSLWPWLGKLYGDGYLWILVIGLLAPLFFVWGRLRQPRGAHPLHALMRFNRLVPYIGMVLLLAIAVG